MSQSPNDPAVGHGRMRFVLGLGPQGTFGDVSLTLLCRPSEPPFATVDWQVHENSVPEFVRQVIMTCTANNLQAYLQTQPVGALRAIITSASWSRERRNEPDRASFWALHHAIRDAGLPPPVIFAPPEPTDENT